MKNKKYWLITSIVILLPILLGLLLWNRLPEKLPTHFGMDGAADGWSGKGFAVFGIPLMMLAFHLLIFAATRLDKQNRGHNEKVLNLVGLIFPVLSIAISVCLYVYAMDVQLSLTAILFPLLGLFFIALGNWLPKIKQNTTLGIKLKWTLYNEENWNKTHRFAGFLWVIGGLLMLPLGFLPAALFGPCLLGNVLLMVLLPTLYSHRLAKRQQRDGTWTESAVSKNLKKHPVIMALSLAALALVLAGTAFVMFTGDIDYTCTDTALLIEADFHSDSTVPYELIDSIEYREAAPQGTRTWGFASARLLMGWFENAEFGSHTRYSYTGVDAHIVLRCGGDTLVLSARNEERTQALYEMLTEYLGGTP